MKLNVCLLVIVSFFVIAGNAKPIVFAFPASTFKPERLIQPENNILDRNYELSDLQSPVKFGGMYDPEQII